ncbi:MAG: DUF3006 family protein [Clostridia bacterium]|nr:DUF3006 family protein [Clostridia bacterium]
MKKTVRMSADRIEGDFYVMIPDDGSDALLLPRADYDLKEGDIADVTLEDGKVTSLTVRADETETRLEKNRSRLASLFAKSKK